MSARRLPEPRSIGEHSASAGCGMADLPRRRFLAGLAAAGLLISSRSARALGELSKFRFLRLRLPDLPDPRPSALRRLAWELERRTSLVTTPDPIELPLASPDLFRYPLCVLSGDRG